MKPYSDLKEIIRQIISDELGVPSSKIDEDSILTTDLGADSLDLVELVMAIEKEFELEIPDSNAEQIITFKDAVNYCYNNLNEASDNKKPFPVTNKRRDEYLKKMKDNRLSLTALISTKALSGFASLLVFIILGLQIVVSAITGKEPNPWVMVIIFVSIIALFIFGLKVLSLVANFLQLKDEKMEKEKNGSNLFSIASGIKTPLSLAALVVIALYGVYRLVLQLNVFAALSSDNTFKIIDSIISKLFYLAVIALVLGFSAYVYTRIIEKRESH